MLTVHHLGMHMCPPKQNITKHRRLVKKLWVRNSSVGTHTIQQAEVGKEIAAGNISEAWGRILQLSYSHIWSKKANLNHERNPDEHSLEAIGIFQEVTDKEDKYLIYKINNPQFNDDPGYAFKTSWAIAELAVEIDQEGPDSLFQGEEAHFDVSPSWHIGYKTFALFVFHPAMQHNLRTATMDMKSKLPKETAFLEIVEWSIE